MLSLLASHCSRHGKQSVVPTPNTGYSLNTTSQQILNIYDISKHKDNSVNITNLELTSQ